MAGMNSMFATLPLLAAVGLLATGLAPSTAAAPSAGIPQGGSHSLRSLHGEHGFTYDGAILGVGPIAASGPIQFDGRGNLSASYATNVNGVQFRGTFVGTYTVNADGSGSVTLQLPRLGLQAHGDFVLVDNGKGTFFSCTDAGFSITGQTRRM